MARSTRVLVSALLVPALLLAGGCGGSPGAPGGSSAGTSERVRGTLSIDVEDADVTRAEDAVARRDDATPAEIFDVGDAQEMSVRPDGSLITTFIASADTEGEGPTQQAWRAFAADGSRVAEGRMSQTGDVVAVRDGFVVLDGSFDAPNRVLHVDPAGRTTRVPTTGTPAYPRAGDTFVPDHALYYRPSPAGLLSAPVPPRVGQAGVAAGKNAALSDDGVLYAYADPPKAPLPLAVTDDGGESWRFARVRTGPDRPSLVVAQGDTAVIALTQRGSTTSLAGLRVTRDAGRTWRAVGSDGGLPTGTYVDQLSLGADGRALVGGYGSGWWRARSAGNTAYDQLALPPGGVSVVRATRDRLFAMSSSSGLWSSTDGGRYWTRLDVRR